MNSATPLKSTISVAVAVSSAPAPPATGLNLPTQWLVFGASVFLVSVPVFFQAPLVRLVPWLSLALTGGWLWLSLALLRQPKYQVWGDLLLGFTSTWLAGALYWGWFRWEPLLHLPVEALGLPLALWCLKRRWGLVGNWFYLGSLLGTAVTDIYFYLTNLIPFWRQVMQAEPNLALPIFQAAIAQIKNPWGIGWGIGLALMLLGLGLYSLRQPKLHAWAFGGAVLSTILVDGLFLVAALAV